MIGLALVLALQSGLPSVTASVDRSRLSVGEELVPKLERVAATWKGRPPKFHLSSQKPGTKTSHADYVERGDLERGRCSIAIAGERPSMRSTSGLASCSRNWRA